MIDLALVVPHPDDEVFGCGGLFVSMAARGMRVATLTLTRGGAGRTLGLVDQDLLADLREAELLRSLEELGVAEYEIRDFPDFVTEEGRGLPARPGLAGVDRAELQEAVTGALRRWRPRAVLTFPPNGSNGHPDHVVTNELVTAALAELETPPEAVYYFAGDAPTGLDPRPGFLPPDRIADLHLPVTHFFEVGDALENKLRAMAQHETQARSVLMFMRRFPNRVLVETFHRVSPEVPPGTPPQAVTQL